MAMIKCSECGREISDKAPACPNCAYPLAQLMHSHLGGPRPSVTIEQTAKTWKALRLLGVLGMIAGPAILFWWGNGETWGAAGLILFLVGAGCVFIARAGAWWENR